MSAQPHTHDGGGRFWASLAVEAERKLALAPWGPSGWATWDGRIAYVAGSSGRLLCQLVGQTGSQRLVGGQAHITKGGERSPVGVVLVGDVAYELEVSIQFLSMMQAKTKFPIPHGADQQHPPLTPGTG